MRCLFISCGQKIKKTNNPISKKFLYLNYGLLSIVSKFNRSGIDAKMYQADYQQPEDFLRGLETLESLSNNSKLFLSIYSYYTLEWAIEFSRIVKEKHPRITLLAGGKWVFSSHGEIEKIMKLIPWVDFVIPGNFNYNPHFFLDKKLSQESIYSLAKKDYLESTISDLSYDLLKNYKEYTPSIEISHGCGSGCDFCVDKDIPLTSIKAPQIIMDEVDRIMEDYETRQINIYYEASIFRASTKWCESHYNEYTKRKMGYNWRCQTRIDSLNIKNLKYLSRSGLKAFDLGLESASSEQLIRTKKTESPDKYLKRASTFLKASFDEGIWNKVNVMLYPGETDATLQETIDWLNDHKQYIKGVSAYPFLHFGLNNDVDIVKLPDNYVMGVKMSDLSDELNFEKALSKTNMLSKHLMSSNDYFDLKKLGYFPRSYTYSNFQNDMSEATSKNIKLPFSIVS